MGAAAEGTNFCWKENNGTVPLREHCADGYRNVADVCWDDCRSGYSDMGFTCTGCSDCGCWWSGWRLRCGSCTCDTYSKKSYIPRQKCGHSNEYVYLGLCQWDCNVIGMDNCGTSACAADADSCATKVAGIIADTIDGAA